MKNNTQLKAWRDIVVTSDTDNFTALRKDFDTQKNVAKFLGLSDQETISRIETTNCDIDPRTYSLFLLLTDNHPKYELKGEESPDKLPIEYQGGDTFKKIRKQSGMTQRSVANHLKLTSGNLISWYEKERQSPSTQTYTLFLLITDNHPHFWLEMRANYFLSQAVFSPRKVNTPLFTLLDKD